MAIAVEVFDNRHLRGGSDALDQALAAARDDHVDKLGHGDQLAHGSAVGGGHQLHRFGRQARASQGLLHQRRQRGIRFDGFAAAAQDAGVAAFDRQAGGLDGHVRPALVNHAEHADGHAHLPHANAAGLLAQRNDVTDHVWHGSQLLAAFGAGFQDGGCQLQAIDHRLGQAGFARARQIALVGRLQRPGVLAQQARQLAQRLVAHGRARAGHGARSLARLQAQNLHGFNDVVSVHASIVPKSAFARAGRAFRQLVWRQERVNCATVPRHLLRWHAAAIHGAGKKLVRTAHERRRRARAW